MATMILTKDEKKAMKDNKECPCCGKRLTVLEVEHLMASGDTQTTESYRGLPVDESIHLQNEIRLQEQLSARREAADNVERYADSWATLLGGDRRTAEIAAAGRRG